MPTVDSIYRYPVKGLNAEKLPAAELTPGQGLAGDRAYAIAHGTTDFDPAAPEHLRKTKFLTLMTHPRLAELTVEWAEGDGAIALTRQGMEVMRAVLQNPEDVDAFSSFLADFIGAEAKGAPKLVTAPGHMFSDVREDCLSLINLASVRALGEGLGQALDPLRFRGNIYVEGLDPWVERSWEEGDELTVGASCLRVMRQIVRCAATNVDPASAVVDVDIPTTLRKSFEQNLMGVYVEVLSGASIKPGDPVNRAEG